MTSNKDDHDDLDMGMGGADDIIDVEGIDEPLSATPLGGADEFDHDGDDEYADESDDDRHASKPKKQSGGMTKIVAPLLVLLVAAGAGGYIVMNPSILGGSPAQIAPAMPGTPPAADTAMLPPPDMPAEMPQETVVADVPPQPLANLNEAPPPVVPEAPVVEEVVAEVPAVAPDAAAPAVTPETPVVEENSVEVLAGNDVNVAPETVALQEQAAPPVVVPESAPAAPEPVPPVAPEVVPEVVPEAAALVPPAPVAEVAPVVAPVPETPVAPAPMPALDVVPTPGSDVTEPTFVPAAPEGTPPVTEVSVADAAVPPVMNVQEVTGAAVPVMPPNTVTPAPSGAVPAPADGQVSAPITPMPTGNDSDVYYDSLAQVPTGAMATSVGPREINPVLEPASKMIIVSKDRGENSAEALLVSANRALKLKRYDSALEMFDQLYAKNKRDVRILMGRAIAQQNMGLNESAIQSYEEILKLKPDNTEALVNMMGLVRSQYPEVALRRLLDLYSKHPNNAGIAAQIGVTNAALGHFDDAMRYLGIASTLEPHNAQHLFNMAIAADRNGNRAQAVQLYERALEVDVMYGASRSVPRERIYDRLSVLRRG